MTEQNAHVANCHLGIKRKGQDAPGGRFRDRQLALFAAEEAVGRHAMNRHGVVDPVPDTGGVRARDDLGAARGLDDK